jgi:endonuclease-3 related protein
LGLLYPEFYNKLYKHFGQQGWWPGDSKLEIVLGAILTQNTAWSNVVSALNNIKNAGTLSLEYLRKTDKDSLALLIRPAGYFNQKTERVKGFIKFLDENYDGHLENLLSIDMPEIRTILLSIKGIGPETADDIILYAAEKPVFVIDAYTKRIISRHLLCKADVSYYDLQNIIEAEVPRKVKIYKEYHGLFVVLAKKFCFKKNPGCDKCPLGSYERSLESDSIT